MAQDGRIGWRVSVRARSSGDFKLRRRDQTHGGAFHSAGKISMMSNKHRFSPSAETVRLLSSAAVDAIMENRATAIGRIGEFSVAAICRNVREDIHAVARVQVVGNDVTIELFNDWDEALKKFGKLVRAS